MKTKALISFAVTANQLRGYREADLRLCFHIRKNPVFSRCGSFDDLLDLSLYRPQIKKLAFEGKMFIAHVNVNEVRCLVTLLL